MRKPIGRVSQSRTRGRRRDERNVQSWNAQFKPRAAAILHTTSSVPPLQRPVNAVPVRINIPFSPKRRCKTRIKTPCSKTKVHSSPLSVGVGSEHLLSWSWAAPLGVGIRDLQPIQTNLCSKGPGNERCQGCAEQRGMLWMAQAVWCRFKVLYSSIQRTLPGRNSHGHPLPTDVHLKHLTAKKVCGHHNHVAR